MSSVPRDPPPGPDVLIRRVDTYLTLVRPALSGADLDLAERLAASLRELVVLTAVASAADRARVRAAVHSLVPHRRCAGRLLPWRSLAGAQQVINNVVRQLGRPDLVVPASTAGPAGPGARPDGPRCVARL